MICPAHWEESAILYDYHVTGNCFKDSTVFAIWSLQSKHLLSPIALDAVVEPSSVSE